MLHIAPEQRRRCRRRLLYERRQRPAQWDALSRSALESAEGVTDLDTTQMPRHFDEVNKKERKYCLITDRMTAAV